MHKKGYWILLGCLFPILAWSNTKMQHYDPVSMIIFWVTVVYGCSIIGQFFAKKLQQPSVLGELLMGILFGNICYYFKVPEVVLLREGSGVFNILPDLLSAQPLSDAIAHNVQHLKDLTLIKNALQSSQGADLLNTAFVLDIFSRYGIIYLLFIVGLETSWKELRGVGKPAIWVASIGVLAPMLLGFLVLFMFFTHNLYQTNLFIAATLSATSVGITARVLQDLSKLRSKEAKIILGAAMIDDVLGLFILAVVSSLVLQGQFNVWNLSAIVLSSALYFVLALSLGPRIVKAIVSRTGFLALWEAKVAVAFIVIMFMSWIANLMNLSTIIGAFTAGLILDDSLFEEKPHPKMTIKDLMAPLQFLLAPLFFFLMGIQVKLESFLNLQVLMIAFLLCIVAVLGKLMGGLGAGSRVNRLFIGIGMIPRGEVGLIFASMGRSIGVVNDEIFSAIVMMVVITTVIAPPWMKWSLKKRELNFSGEQAS